MTCATPTEGWGITPADLRQPKALHRNSLLNLGRDPQKGLEALTETQCSHTPGFGIIIISGRKQIGHIARYFEVTQVGLP